MASSIFVVEPTGDLKRMRPSAPRDEDKIQELVARYPEIIGGSGRLLLVRREQGIPDSRESSGRWSIDHLFVTDTALPVLVEVKRAVDTRLRREVVGQMLDYAANGVAHWPAGTLAQAFAQTCLDNSVEPESVLEPVLGERTAEAFWAQVDANLVAGRIRMVFVADNIPPELATIVEFLNEQMQAEVVAVELGWFEADGGLLTLVPRIIGETARANVAKRSTPTGVEPLSADEWLQAHMDSKGPAAAQVARRWVALVHSLGGNLRPAKTMGSLIASFPKGSGVIEPASITTNGRISIAFGAVSTVIGESVRRAYYDRFTNAVGKLSAAYLETGGWPSFPMERLTDVSRNAAFEETFREWVHVCTNP